MESVAGEGGPAKGHVGYIPFPAGPGGTPGSALGGEMLAINAKSSHAAAAWKLIQYLTSSPVEIARAEATGDPPSLPSRLHRRAVREGAVLQGGKDAQRATPQPRPVSPNYLQISTDLQTAISSVFANSSSASSGAELGGRTDLESAEG